MQLKLTRTFPLFGLLLAPTYGLTAAELTNKAEVTPRIVGGKPANAEEWKFYTQIVSSNSNRSFCGASYIGDGYVLTAAHCVDSDSPSQIDVKIGGYRYNGTDGVRADVSQIYIHPSYNKQNLSNDIALLKLTSIPQGVATVEIAKGSLSQYASVGDSLTVAGLGRLSEGGSSPSVLQEVDVPLISDATCRQAGGSYSSVGDVSFCAGIPEGGIDSCQGDSGGPIVINRSGNITQLGIVSWGIGCARPGKYGVYSDIAALQSFVDSVVGTSQPPVNNVNVGYTTTQNLSDMKLGELKNHRFEIVNQGQSEFTIESAKISHNTIATQPIVYADSCSSKTLQAGSLCSLSVEFGGQASGVAKVQLEFTIDKTDITYQSEVTTRVLDTTTPPTSSCDTWDSSSIYNSGDTVSWNNQIWEAQWWTQGNDPTQSGPWGVWQLTTNASCSNGTPPVEPPTLPEPTPPTSGDQYLAGQSYAAGDVVNHNGIAYQCKPWPYNLWCGATPSAYEPGVGSAWKDAWTAL